MAKQIWLKSTHDRVMKLNYLNINTMNQQQATLKVQGLKGNIPDDQLAEKIGISKPTLYTRLVKSNWKKGEIELIKQL